MNPNQLSAELGFRYRHPLRWHLWHLAQGIVLGAAVFFALFLAALELAWMWRGRH